MCASVAEFACESPPHHKLTALSRSGERYPQPALVVLRAAEWRIGWVEIEQNPRDRRVRFGIKQPDCMPCSIACRQYSEMLRYIGGLCTARHLSLRHGSLGMMSEIRGSWFAGQGPALLHYAPWQRLYFLLLPHGQRSLRPTFCAPIGSTREE